MLKIITADGNSNKLKIIDPETGADVTRMLCVTALDIMLRPRAPALAVANIEFVAADLDVERCDWKTKHPITGERAALAAIEFRDGTRVAFSEDGSPVLGKVDARRPEPAELTAFVVTITPLGDFYRAEWVDNRTGASGGQFASSVVDGLFGVATTAQSIDAASTVTDLSAAAPAPSEG